MEKFFEAAINLVKSDEGIVLIVLIVAIMTAVIVMNKGKKVKDSFSGNVGGEVDVTSKSSTEDVSIKNSGNDNRDTKIKIEL